MSQLAVGIHIVQPNPNEAIKRIKDGFKLLAYSLDITMVQKACIEGLSEIRKTIS